MSDRALDAVKPDDATGGDEALNAMAFDDARADDEELATVLLGDDAAREVDPLSDCARDPDDAVAEEASDDRPEAVTCDEARSVELVDVPATLFDAPDERLSDDEATASDDAETIADVTSDVDPDDDRLAVPMREESATCSPASASSPGSTGPATQPTASEARTASSEPCGDRIMSSSVTERKRDHNPTLTEACPRG